MRLLVLLAAFFAALPVYAGSGDWHTVKSTHFVVWYRNTPEEFARRVSAEAERGYDEITDNLGLLRHDFWLWENRANVYVYDDDAQYQEATGMPVWSAGASLPREKSIHTIYGKEGFFERILPHELGHIVFREFVGFDNAAVPRWLDEGAASYQEQARMVSAVVARLASAGELIPLEQLSLSDPHRMKSQEAVEQFYAEAVGVVDFLIRRRGKDGFVQFCRSLRDTQDLDRALSFAYSIRGVRDLDREWQENLK